LTLQEALTRGTLDPSHIGLITYAPRKLWRVYSRRFGAVGFNGTSPGNARFSPLEHGGAVVPTLYAGTTPEVALMETVLHDLPLHSAGHSVQIEERVDSRRVSSFTPSRELTLVDLSTLGLRKLGLSRSDVIDCEKVEYLVTRRLATWLYENAPMAHGLLWTSRQDDRAQALILFETRLASVALDVQEEDQPFTDGTYYDSLVGLAGRLGATLRILR
jgi:hypothetical protein